MKCLFDFLEAGTETALGKFAVASALAAKRLMQRPGEGAGVRFP